MDNVINYLLNYATKHNIRYKLTEALPSSFPSCAFPKSRRVMINMKWRNPHELPFQIAHELGHVLNGDNGVRYYESFPTRSKTEYQANLTGIRLLLKFCADNDINVDNPLSFAERFGIPEYLENAVAYEMKGISQ